MASKVPCAVCGELRWRSTHRGAPAQPTCRACRTANVKHGTPSTYKKRGCRCDLCRAAWNEQCKQIQATARERKGRMVRSCDQCGALFNPRASQVRCSESCMRAWRSGNKAQRRGAGEVGPVDPAAVFARDDWTCGICELPVDPTAKYPDPGSASLDHVIPLARGGAHTLENVQCSHLYCNTVKGAREVAAC